MVPDLADVVLRPTLNQPLQEQTPDTPSLTSNPPCKCKLNDGKPCFSAFEEDELYSVRDQYLAMTKDELDIAILSKLSCGKLPPLDAQFLMNCIFYYINISLIHLPSFSYQIY